MVVAPTQLVDHDVNVPMDTSYMQQETSALVSEVFFHPEGFSQISQVLEKKALSDNMFQILSFCLITLIASFFYELLSLDINECDEDPNLCKMNGDCLNTPGSFSCLCRDGYKVANRGRMCVGKPHTQPFSTVGCFWAVWLLQLTPVVFTLILRMILH